MMSCSTHKYIFLFSLDIGPGAGLFGSGASYGGLGGKSGSTDPVYGSVTNPVNFGSGAGGLGGGMLKLKVDTILSVEGNIIFLVRYCS